jgi:hypothetical protein
MLVALLLAAPAPEMRSERLSDGGYRIVLTAPGLTLEQGQARAMAEAARLCGGPPVTLGHYRWRSNERLDHATGARTPVSLTLEQEARCDAAPPPVSAAQGPASSWRPGPADEASVLDFTARYFAARDSGRYAEAWALLTPTMQEMSPLAEWRRQAAEFARGAGAIRRRTPVKVTWYDSPAGVEPGIYAAVDFVGEAEKLLMLCGYVVWRRQGDGSFRLVRDEQNVVGRDSAPRMTAEKLAQIRASLNCAEPS